MATYFKSQLIDPKTGVLNKQTRIMGQDNATLPKSRYMGKFDYSKDVPPESKSKCSFQYNSGGSSKPFQWVGWCRSFPKGHFFRMSMWIKFHKKVPPISGNFGLKFYGNVRNSWVKDCKPDKWHYVSDVIKSEGIGDGHHLILIFDSIPTQCTINVCDLTLEVSETEHFDKHLP
eukprot:UN13387